MSMESSNKKMFKLYQGDNMESFNKLPDNSIDSVVTDGPYGLSFMGKKWDYDVPSVEFWKEVYRVLKPGGHVLSFGGTRTYHRMVVNIEDAGFEIRDQIQWLYGSGFPKSHNIGKAVDKLQGNEREVVGERDLLGPAIHEGGTRPDGKGTIELTKGTTPQEGWGTALKPANEPICVARKPISEKTVAENVLKWGTGGINVDGCRIGTDDKMNSVEHKHINQGSVLVGNGLKDHLYEQNPEGRFPANIIFDESAAELLDEQSGVGKSNPRTTPLKGSDNGVTDFGQGKNTNHTDKGGASRFFYVAKVSKSERNMGLDGFEDKKPDYIPRYSINDDGDMTRADGSIVQPVINKNTHPTLKPVQLMSYLVRLVTPPNGIVLDPFMGSGSTGIATLLEGFRFCGMEMDEDYFKIAEARIEAYELYRPFVEKKTKKK